MFTDWVTLCTDTDAAPDLKAKSPKSKISNKNREVDGAREVPFMYPARFAYFVCLKFDV